MFISLLTDFGLQDPYVAQVKARILSIAPQAQIIDLTHHISSFNLLEAGFVLFTSYQYFPAATLFVAVVDPGVGTKREIILAKEGQYLFLVPNNGLLTFFIQKNLLKEVYFLKKEFPTSTTFQGRDIFARVAAHICKQEDRPTWWQKTDLNNLIKLNLSEPKVSSSKVEALIYYQDKFGNLILNLENKTYAPYFPLNKKGKLKNFSLRVVNTYAELGEQEVGLIKGSQGFYELCLNKQSLAKILNTQPGEKITWQWTT